MLNNKENALKDNTQICTLFILTIVAILREVLIYFYLERQEDFFEKKREIQKKLYS